MTDSFKEMLRVLEQLGDVSEATPMNRNGKPSKFVGTVKSKMGNREVNLGVLYYPWNRKVGSNKIIQAAQFTEKADLDGAVVVGSSFTTSAIEQAFRNNNVTDKRLLLMDQEEVSAMIDTLDNNQFQG